MLVGCGCILTYGARLFFINAKERSQYTYKKVLILYWITFESNRPVNGSTDTTYQAYTAEPPIESPLDHSYFLKASTNWNKDPR
jgi:hypothetical protein